MPDRPTNSAATEDKGLAAIASYCAYHKKRLIWREINRHDIGIDGEIEFESADGKERIILKVQAKSTVSDGSYIIKDQAGSFVFKAKKKHVEYWQKLTNDVLLIVFDGRKGQAKLYAKKIEGYSIPEDDERIEILFDKKKDFLDPESHDFIERFSGEEGRPETNFYPASFPTKFKYLRYFVGREKVLEEVRRQLALSHRVSLCNISGIGKTFCAYRYASLYRSSYKHVFFVNAASEAWLESLAEFGRLKGNADERQPQEALALVFTEWLEKHSGWLVIFDNVDIPEELEKYIPANPDGDCIFTSNDSQVQNFGARADITNLQPKESALLLYSRSKAKVSTDISFSKPEEETAFWQIVNDIDGLPVSLNTTAACIYDRGLSFAEYLEDLEDEPDLDLKAEDQFDPYKKSTLKAFALAIERNTSAEDKPEEERFYAEATKQLYIAAAFIAPDDIHEEFLRAFLEANNNAFAKAKNQNVIWRKIRKKFQEFDLFKYNSSAESFSTHRLIQKCIFSRLSDADKKAYAEKVLNLLEDFFPLYDYTNKEQCERYYQHTLAALENADRIGFEAGFSNSLYFRVAWYQELLGNYPQAEKFYTKDLEISRKVYGERHKQTGATLNNLANLYRTQGKLEKAVEFFEQTINVTRKVFGKKHPNYAVCLNNLALVYDSQGKYDEAIGLYKEATEITGKALGKEHPAYARRLNNLANVYKAQKDYAKAIPMYEDAIWICEKSLGSKHVGTATSSLELATCYGDLKRYDEALSLYQKVLDIYKENLGVDHPWVATALNNLAWIYRNQKKYSEALPLFEEALRIWEAKLPPEHPDIAIAKKGIEYCKEKVTSNE